MHCVSGCSQHSRWTGLLPYHISILVLHVLHRYQSTVLGSYQTIELIETFVNYAESIKRCVCIVYDPQTSARGTLTLKAITLKDNFIKVQSPCTKLILSSSLCAHSMMNVTPHVLSSFMAQPEHGR